MTDYEASPSCSNARADRLLRMYVSHAALIRPLNEKGKTKLNRDTAMVETTISGKHGPSYRRVGVRERSHMLS